MSHVVYGFDMDTFRAELKSYIRSLNYEGDIKIRASIHDNTVTVYSAHWINQLRQNPFVYWFCIIMQLWIITWPVILLLERRYHVVQSRWWSSREESEDDRNRNDESGSSILPLPSFVRRNLFYAGGRGEEELAAFYAPIVMEAAWEQRHGGVLTDSDIRRLQQRQERLKQIGWLEPEIVQMPRLQNHGRSHAIGPLVLNLRVRDFQAGWGYDS